MPVLFDLEDPLAADKMEALLADYVGDDGDLEFFDATALPDEAFWN